MERALRCARRSGAWTALALAALWGCAGEDTAPPTVATDVLPADASGADAAVDALPDAAPDTRTDSGPLDAAPGSAEDAPPGGTDGADTGSPSEDAGPLPPSTIRQLVDPFIGTGGRGWWAGNSFVGAQLPFGMVQLGPDTEGEYGASPWSNCSGFHIEDTVLRRLSHTHLHGTGLTGAGAIGVLPLLAPPAPETLPAAPSATLDLATRQASPGAFEVRLDTGVLVELTATEHTGVHRYTFPAGATPVLLVDADTVAGGDVLDSAVEVDAEAGRLRGQAAMWDGFTAPAGGVRVYFAAAVGSPVTSFATWHDGVVEPGVAAAQGKGTGAWLAVSPGPGGAVELQVALSYVSEEQAEANLAAERSGFDDARAAAELAWDRALSILRIEGAPAEQATILATSLYHTMLMPTSLTDAGGTYRGFDGEVHEADGFTYYTAFSLWDTYRTLHPLLTLIAPDRQRDMVRSLLKMAQHGGSIPKWPLGTGYTNVMIGTPGDIVIAESYVKGITDFDADFALDTMLRTAREPPEGSIYEGREGVLDVVSLGYVAADHELESVSATLEGCVADAAIGRLAAALGREDDAALFAERSRNYANLWDPEVGYFRGRKADGTWLTPFDPLTFEAGTGHSYTEGTGWQVRWLVPHDMAGLMALFGSPEVLAVELRAFLEHGRDELEQGVPETTELQLMGLAPRAYWHGNEPGLHAPFLFLQAGRPDLAQRWIRWAADAHYGAGPYGLAGNDDAGTLAAWYIFAALGLYPIAGTDAYLVGTPLFPHVELDLPGGTLVVDAPGASQEKPYVAAVLLDGAPLTEPWLRHGDLTTGATLSFTMSATPASWGRTTDPIPR